MSLQAASVCLSGICLRHLSVEFLGSLGCIHGLLLNFLSCLPPCPLSTRFSSSLLSRLRPQKTGEGEGGGHGGRDHCRRRHHHRLPLRLPQETDLAIFPRWRCLQPPPVVNVNKTPTDELVVSGGMGREVGGGGIEEREGRARKDRQQLEGRKKGEETLLKEVAEWVYVRKLK